MVLEKTLQSPLDSKEIKPVHPKGNQPWIFIGRMDAGAEPPILWPPDLKSRLIGKDPDARKDWGQEEKGTTEDKMVGWHHGLNGHGSDQAPGFGDGQGSLAWCSSWYCEESDTTEWLNNNKESLALKKIKGKDLPSSPGVTTSLLNAGSAGSIPGRRAKIAHALRPKKNQNIKQQR